VPKLRQQFGRNLRSLRLSKDWTQEELAERLGTSVNFLSYVERGLKAPSFDSLEKIAKIFRISVAGLFEIPSTIRIGERVRRSTHGSKRRTLKGG
jgi:transcriptional regulator with XRE-family HTH domain